MIFKVDWSLILTTSYLKLKTIRSKQLINKKQIAIITIKFSIVWFSTDFVSEIITKENNKEIIYNLLIFLEN